MRKITFLKMMFVAIALVIGSVNVWATYSGTGTFTKITTLAEIESGAYYVFYGINSTYTGAMNNTVASGKLANTTVTLSGNTISNPSTAIVWKIEGNSTTGYTIFNEAITKYCEITANTTSGFALNSTTSHTFEATINGTKGFFFKSNHASASSRGISIYQSDWRPYLASAAYTLNLYKFVTSSCTPSTLAFTNTTVNKTTADAAFTQTATSLNGTTAITYASNNTAVANVNETTGEVTLVGAGVATITATQAAGAHSAVDYCAATATYTLNVASILPTITVTEVTVPAMVALVGNTVTETVNVSGVNLDENLTVSIIDDVNNQFDEPSVTSIAKLGDNTASGTVTVTYRPTAAGAHTATLKIESLGATSVTRALSGTATWTPLTTPVATTANPISNSGFTANWDAVIGATDYQLDVYTKTSNPLADLIISEYGEGSSNNKYVEIFNGTGASVDLSNYTLKQAYNGTGWDIDITYTLPLTGTLANNDVYVISTSDANQTILDQADKTMAYSNSLQGGRVVSFTGNDAIGLFKNGVLIDLFGDPAVTSTISVAGAAMGDNHTMVRKSNITTGNTSWTTSAGTDATSSEWTVNASDTWTFIGTHNYLGVTKTPVSGSPFTVTSETSKAISGLSAETTYYYTVVAKNANVASAVSNEITVTTGPTTSIDQLGDKLNLHVSDNRIEFISSANETVAVYNAVGQKLVQKVTVSGLNSIPVSARGVVLVKVGNRFAKVIL